MIEQAPILILLAPLLGAMAVTFLGLWRREWCAPAVFVALAASLG
jgi:hypothetical protein